MNQEISELRKRVEKIDSKIIRLFEKRVELSKEIGLIKRDNGFKIEDLSRENKIIEEKKKNSSLNRKFTKDLFRLIFKESKRIQKSIWILNKK